MEATTAAEFLIQAFDDRKEKNPRYSLRAFARSLGVSSGQLSEILSGKRPLSHKLSRRIAIAMSLPEDETKRLTILVSQQKHFLDVAGPNSRQLSEEELTLMTIAQKLDPMSRASSLLNVKGLGFENTSVEVSFSEMDHEVVLEVKKAIRSFRKKLRKVLETTDKKSVAVFEEKAV